MTVDAVSILLFFCVQSARQDFHQCRHDRTSLQMTVAQQAVVAAECKQTFVETVGKCADAAENAR